MRRVEKEEAACMAKPREVQQEWRSRRAKKKSRGTLWKRRPRRGAIIRTRMAYKGSSSIIPNLRKVWKSGMSCRR